MTNPRQDPLQAPEDVIRNVMSDPTPLPPTDPPIPVPPIPPAPPGPDSPPAPVEDPPGQERPVPGDPTEPPAGDPPSDPPVRMKEIGGPAGPEPTRYGDWERKGRVSDF